MLRIGPAVTLTLAALSLGSAQAATYEAHVEGGNTVVIVGKSKKAERCQTSVPFTYVDPKEPGKRQPGYQSCPPRPIVPGKATVMCAMDYPVVEIQISEKVTIRECMKPQP